ncbi:MAG: phosphatase PAP2 family protein [Candidatus Heimdallarchaeota archaeon]|nr:phosphatase PAP2 family protein [Candidatus Heimdallarchaeota archaeon]
MKLQYYLITILSFIIILLVGISRIYLGVHWLYNVLTGWMFGLALLIIVVFITEPLKRFITTQNLTQNQLFIGLAFFGFIFMILTAILDWSRFGILSREHVCKFSK